MEISAHAGSTVLVTGGSGFLGSWCLAELLDAGHRVRTTVRSLDREGAVRGMLERAGAVTDGRLRFVEADLGADAGWAEAVAGCDYVLHVASPLPAVQPDDPDEVIIPAREGTLRVLGAALDADVKRVVVTSSVAAIRNSAKKPGPGPITEDNWTDAGNASLTPYTRSKTIAEQAAWKLVDERGQRERLAVVNPGAILGPVLSDDRSYSLQLVERLLGGMPGIPKLGFSIVDVRDVAALQVKAMSAPVAGGERFIAVNSFLWMEEVAQILHDRLGDAGVKVTTRTVPNLFVRAMALFDSSLRSVVGDLGKRVEYSNAKAVESLGWTPRAVETTIVETAESLISEGVVGTDG